MLWLKYFFIEKLSLLVAVLFIIMNFFFTYDLTMQSNYSEVFSIYKTTFLAMPIMILFFLKSDLRREKTVSILTRIIDFSALHYDVILIEIKESAVYSMIVYGAYLFVIICEGKTTEIELVTFLVLFLLYMMVAWVIRIFIQIGRNLNVDEVLIASALIALFIGQFALYMSAKDYSIIVGFLSFEYIQDQKTSDIMMRVSGTLLLCLSIQYVSLKYYWRRDKI